MERMTKKIAIYTFIVICAFVLVENRFTSFYIAQLNAMPSVSASKVQDPLYQEIEEKAAKFEVPPQDAKIDRVWKAMPGLNGLKVDIKNSYKNMKRTGVFDEKKLIFKQIPPSIHLKDLPPEAIYRGHPDKQMVSFLINVAWGNEYLPGMLETLKKHRVKATFFLEGRWAKENPDLAKMIVDAGHEVGNHSYTHPNLSVMSSTGIREQLEKTNEVIKATVGKECVWFAPPSGNYKPEVVKIAGQMNMKTIMWSVDTIDWQRPEPEVLIERVVSKVHPGAMVLMHPTASTANALDRLILRIKQKNYQIGDVSTLLSEQRLED